MALEEEGVEGGDVLDEFGPASGVSDSFDEVHDDVRSEKDWVVEGVFYPGEDVAHLAVTVERCGGGEGFVDGLNHVLDDFEVGDGSLAGVVGCGRCHGGMIREVGEEWNSRRGTKRSLLGFRL